jgi:hypothetical protein
MKNINEDLDWKEAQLNKVLKQNKIFKKKPEKIIKDILEQKITANDIPFNSFYRYILEFNTERIDLDLFLCLLKNKCENLLENKQYVKALHQISLNKQSWVREPKTWKRPSHNIHKQIKDLIRHLFLKYKTPEFLNNAWTNNFSYKGINSGGVPRKLFLHIASGENIRTFPSLPFDLTKKMAHEFMTAPSDYEIEEAFIWAITKSFNGDERLVQTINGTILLSKINSTNTNKDEKEFWITIIEFLAKNPMIDPVKISPMIDYINQIKFEKERIWVDGLLRLTEPEQSNFKIKGKNIERLIEKTEEWHNKLNKENKIKSHIPKTWKGFDVEDFKLEEGKDSNKKTYYIYQLLNQLELSQEGKAMNHCVSSYARSCANGTCSIWSLRTVDFGGNIHRMVTVELRGNTIVQIRGKYNKSAEQKDMYIINRWATKEGLIVSRWC